MPGFKRVLKNTFFRAVRSTGAFEVAANSRSRREKLLILCYHGLSLRDEHEWAGHLFMRPALFHERLLALRRLRANILPLSEAVTLLRQGALPPRSVALTFDDGFYDFLEHAVPALHEFGAPCTLYFTTYYSEHQFPIVNLMLNYLFWKAGKSAIALPEFGVAEPMPAHDWPTRMTLVQRLLQRFDEQKLSTAEKDAAARRIAASLSIDDEELWRSRVLQIMTPAEAGKAAAARVDLQLHTHRHRTPRERSLFVREIEDNRVRIEAITGKRPVHFCYPSGVHAHEFLPWLRECGVQTATTCERGFASAGSDSMLLPRLLDDNNMETVQFEAYVSGLIR